MGMTSLIKRALVVLLMGVMLIGSAATAYAQRSYSPAPWDEGGPSLPEDLEVSLVTFGPGSDVPSWFGHSAMGVMDKRLGTQRLYNYGMFSFDSMMVLRFVKGRLEFWVAPTPFQGTLRSYARQDRDVRVQVLDLAPEKAAEIAQFLEWNIRPENREYLYHHYDDNCSTRLRDIVDKATDGQLKAKLQATPARLTLRGHTRRHAVWPIIDFGMMFLMTSAIDAPISAWEEAFLPVELEGQLDQFEVKGADGKTHKLIKETRVFNQAKSREPTPEQPRVMWPWLGVLGLLAGLISWALAWWHVHKPTRLNRVLFGLYTSFIGASFGGAGILLLLMWFFTDHTLTHRNENLLWANPALFAAVWLGLSFARGKNLKTPNRLARLYLICPLIAGVALLLKVLPWFSQVNWLTISLMLPLHLFLFMTARQLFCEDLQWPLGQAKPEPKPDAQG